MTRKRTVHLMSEPKRRRHRQVWHPWRTEGQWRQCYKILCWWYFRKSEKAKRDAYARFAVYRVL